MTQLTSKKPAEEVSVGGFAPIILAIPYTLMVTVGAFLIGFVIAIPLMFMRGSKFVPFRLVAQGFIDIARGIPPIVWLFFIYFGLPGIGVLLDPLEAAIIGLGIISAGYLAEIFRGGLVAAHKGQFEASHALGLGGWTMFTKVIAPQALRAMLPGLATYFIGLVKDSSIASVIGVTEMVFAASTYARRSPEGILLFFIAAIVYMALSIPMGLAARGMEARMRKAGAR